jgi:predicted hydrocarbon binding protein
MTKYFGGRQHSPIRHEGSLVYFDYVGNPQTGVKVANGFCLCPLVEKGPEGLSGTYCECSIGYVNAMFEHVGGKSVRVELLESLKRGGRGCRFKIHLQDT